MRSLGKIFAFTVVIALVGAVFYFIYQGALVTWQFVDVLEPATKVVLLTSAITAVVVAFIIVYGLRSSAAINQKAALSERRYELYVNMIASLRGLLDENGSPTQKNELSDFLKACNAEFLMLASGSTVKAYLALQQVMDAEDRRLPLNCLEVMWKKMRKDLGVDDNFEIFNPEELTGLLPDATSLKLHRHAEA